MVAWGPSYNYWLVFGARTTWPSWLKYLETGNENRARGWVAVFESIWQPPVMVWWDAAVPWDGEKCLERNTCGRGIGPHMFTPVWIDNVNGFPVERKLWLFVRDDVGCARPTSGNTVYTVNVELAESRIGFTKEFIADIPVALTDVAQGTDGTLYGLAGGPGCSYATCTEIREWVSSDGGRSWKLGTRSWSAKGKQLPGGLPPIQLLVFDGAYVRDVLGHFNQNKSIILAIVSETQDATSGRWRIHYWADPGAELPESWGKPMGWQKPRVRRHLERSGMPN
jgi:hypothetical protein